MRLEHLAEHLSPYGCGFLQSNTARTVNPSLRGALSSWARAEELLTQRGTTSGVYVSQPKCLTAALLLRCLSQLTRTHSRAAR